VTQQLDDFTILQQENEELKKHNEYLETQLRVLRKATEELEKLREGAAIERIATEARNKVLGGLGILGVASIVGFLGIYTTALNTIKEEFSKPDRLDKIQHELLRSGKLEKALEEKVLAQVSKDVSNKFLDMFKTDKEFQQALINAVAENVLKNPEFTTRITATAILTADNSIKQVAQQDPNSPLSIAADEVLNQKSYFVVAASSKEPNELRNLISKVPNLDLKGQICPPRKGNKRSVLLVTNTSSIKLSLDAANAVKTKAKNIEHTAYILPTEPTDNVFFDPDNCK